MTADGQKADDAFRDKLLGTTCFCGVSGGSEAQSATLSMLKGITVTVELPASCSPLKCLAHGYCVVHSTPVAAQMTEDEKTRLMKRAGWMAGR